MMVKESSYPKDYPEGEFVILNSISSLPNLLMYEDRNSMAFSIEARVPYLDHNVVEFMASLKTDQIYEIMISKVILRKYLRDTYLKI